MAVNGKTVNQKPCKTQLRKIESASYIKFQCKLFIFVELGSFDVAQTDLELAYLLPKPSEIWKYVSFGILREVKNSTYFQANNDVADS